MAPVLALLMAACGSDDAESSNSSTVESGTVTSVAQPTPALLAGASHDEAAVRAELAKSNPSAARSLDDVLKGNVQGVVDGLRHDRSPCENVQDRAGNACQTRGLQPGAIVDRATLDPLGTYYGDVGVVTAAVRHLLDGRSPKLGLLARGSDGRVIAIVNVTPGLPFEMPGGVQDGQIRITRLQLHLAGDGTILGIEQVSDSTPPLEVIRFITHQDKVDFKILYASPEFEAVEKAFADKLKAESKTK